MKKTLFILCLMPLIAFGQHDFECTTCHDWQENMYTNACLDCHYDLNLSHPVLRTYPLWDEGFHPPSTQTVLGGTIETDLLKNGITQCTSCHKIHFPEYEPLLIMSNQGSQLCLTCHNK